MYYTIEETIKALKEGKTTSVELVQNSIDTFLEIYGNAVELAKEADAKIAEAKAAGTLDKLFEEKPLLGLPFANKDNISVQGQRLTCSSKILEGYRAPYNATVINRLVNAGAIPLGR